MARPPDNERKNLIVSLKRLADRPECPPEQRKVLLEAVRELKSLK